MLFNRAFDTVRSLTWYIWHVLNKNVQASIYSIASSYFISQDTDILNLGFNDNPLIRISTTELNFSNLAIMWHRAMKADEPIDKKVPIIKYLLNLSTLDMMFQQPTKTSQYWHYVSYLWEDCTDSVNTTAAGCCIKSFPAEIYRNSHHINIEILVV